MEDQKEFKCQDKVLFNYDATKKLKIRLLEYRDQKYVDIRKFFGNYPSRKGVRMTVETFLKILNNKDLKNKLLN